MTFLKGAVLGYFLPIFVYCNFFIVLIFFENCSVLWKDWTVFKKYTNAKKIAIFELFWSIFQFFENCWMSVFSRNLFVDILNYTLTVTRVKTYGLLPFGVFLWIIMDLLLENVSIFFTKFCSGIYPITLTVTKPKEKLRHVAYSLGPFFGFFGLILGVFSCFE